MTPMTNVDLARALKVLGHPARLQLLQLLAEPDRFPQNMVDPKQVGVCVNDLAKATGLPQSTASHHLSLLHEAGLIVITEHGSWRYIRSDRVQFGTVAAAVSALAP
ncbi:MAG: helix-turn-helix transcriptional regulator [Candidatus Sericytochromatia bacterium]|nr:helix-turn-helix transcriptional regulator [Candidatus Sericytochromatia bacterium]